MTSSPVPSAARPETIGKIVSIQIFERDRNDKTQIISNTLLKVVGRLQSYWVSELAFSFRIEGSFNSTQVDFDREYVEIFVHEEN